MSTTTSSTLHRRLIGALAAVALALGISVTASPAAGAATVWDKVAKCESGGNWKINTGNGYYGGLQFSGPTWRGYGGGKYASRANRATKGEQIAIARRVLAGQGPGAWPTCSRRADLTRSNGKASRTATPSTNPGVRKVAAKKPPKVRWDKKAAAGSKHRARTTRVRSGDTLVSIAARYSVDGGWRGLWKLNRSTVKNPDRIKVGQVLRTS